MTIEHKYYSNGTGPVPTLTECPFCNKDLTNKRPAYHIQDCLDAPRTTITDKYTDRQG